MKKLRMLNHKYKQNLLGKVLEAVFVYFVLVSPLPGGRSPKVEGIPFPGEDPPTSSALRFLIKMLPGEDRVVDFLFSVTEWAKGVPGVVNGCLVPGGFMMHFFTNS